jgi:glycosyltransferase involved in cell wall biosynthesis
MRVGIYLGDSEPTGGGGFTFVSTVLDAFLESADRSPHTFTIFGKPAHVRLIANRAAAIGVKAIGVKQEGARRRIATFARHYFPAYALLGSYSPLERVARRHDIQFMWFVTGDAFDSLDIPYMATVLDIQHRTHPWFPEVSSRGRWDYRDVSFGRFLRRASRIITGTEVGRAQLGSYYQIPPDRVSVLPHPVPRGVSEGHPGAAVDAGVARLANRTYLLYPAQFWAHKNHATLVVALKILREQLKQDVDLVLTGSDQGNANFISRLVSRLDLSSHVHFLGFVSVQELAFLYRHALALAYVSWSGPENLPPLEAFSLGCPVINADFAGAREQLGAAALYVDPKDPRSVADAVQDLLRDSEKRARLVELGKARSESWTASDYVAGVLGILDEFSAIRECWE